LNTAIACQEHKSRIGGRARCHSRAQRQRDGQPHGYGQPTVIAHALQADASGRA
jgi:hypothetical protein